MKRNALDTTAHGKPPAWLLDHISEISAVATSPIKILDVGCGRGSRVAWLLENGWNAWGYDVEAAYIKAGKPYFERCGWGANRIELQTADAIPFESSTFDLILSDQVIEHVADLDQLAGELARVSAPGSAGIHVYPATWRPLEPHLRTPFVHWLPKGRIQRSAITTAMRLGVSVNHFDDLGNDARAEIYTRFAEEETFYRPRHAVAKCFKNHGFDTSFTNVGTKVLAAKYPKVNGAALKLLATAQSVASQTYLSTTFFE
jgi:SAM-dependent methyltransferase